MSGPSQREAARFSKRLALAAGEVQVRVDRERGLDQLVVEQRHAHLHAAGHAGVIDLQQHVVHQERVDVEQLEPRHARRVRRVEAAQQRERIEVRPLHEQAFGQHAVQRTQLPQVTQQRVGSGRARAAPEGEAPARRAALVPAIAGEQLVRAVAGEDHGHAVTAREARHRERRQARGVEERLVVERGEVGDQRQRRVQRQHLLVHPGPDALGREPREAALVRGRIVESDREARQAGARDLARDRGRRARVDAAGEEHADGDVAHQLHAHRLFELLAHQLHGGVRVAHARRVAELPVALAPRTAAVEHQPVSRRQLRHPRPDAGRVGHVAVHEVVLERGGVHAAPEARVREDRAGLRGEDQTVLVRPVVERLDAEPVAREQQALAPLVPDPEGEDAAQVIHAGVAPFLVGVEDHLRVGRRAEGVALGFELLAQLAEVVDLAVEAEPDAAVLVLHRLRALLGEIDDREAPVPERDAPLGEPLRALAVGSTRRERGEHAGEGRLVDDPLPAHLAEDSAHGFRPPLPALASAAVWGDSREPRPAPARGDRSTPDLQPAARDRRLESLQPPASERMARARARGGRGARPASRAS